MRHTIELLAPGGDIDSIKAAIVAGADAVYCGLSRFNARNRAANINFDDLLGILNLAHTHDCRVFLTLNIIIVESEIPALFKLLNKLYNTSIDGIIVQDLGLFYILSTYFPRLNVHASTQLTTHNGGQVLFLKRLSVKRINLSRELNLHEIKELTAVCHEQNIQSEVFVHGSYCISFSGLCYMSSVQNGNSGNRGRCSQPCRDQYATTPSGKEFPLNLKDNSAFGDLRELAEAGVDSLKIEGRIKKFHYVYTVVDAWRKQLDLFNAENKLKQDKSAFYTVFNRDFSNDFLAGNISKDMFIDNPRDHSAIHLSGLGGISTAETLEKAKGEVYDMRTGIIRSVEERIEALSIAKKPLRISLSGEEGSPLALKVETPDASFSLFSESNLIRVTAKSLDREILADKLKAINDTEFYIERLNVDKLQEGLFVPFKELSALRYKIMYILNGSKGTPGPIEMPAFGKNKETTTRPSLAVLISSPEDLPLCMDTSARIYFQLPNCIGNDYAALIDMFVGHERLIPWFPAVLIGEDYTTAVRFLQELQPKCIVTNNTGIAYEAHLLGIPWIAGPFLNVVNSFSLLCLKENFSCSGAFISNEINGSQIKTMKKPDDFELFFSIYHPITLMTSRQCLFHQVSGCEKNKIDDTCIQHCEKSSAITNLKAVTSFISKTQGNYHTVYHETHCMNTAIVSDNPGLFAAYLIDLRDIETTTIVEINKQAIIRCFEDLLNGKPGSESELSHFLHPTSNRQYTQGI